MVEAVETDSVTVHWQCRAYSADGPYDLKEQPHFLIQGENLKKLKLLNVFEPCTLQIGDRLYYTYKETDNVMTKDQWRTHQKELFLEKAPNTPKFNVNKNKTTKGIIFWILFFLPGVLLNFRLVFSGHAEVKSTDQQTAALSPLIVNNEEAERSPEKSPIPQLKLTESGPCEDWETDASQDDTASVSSGCSSNSSSAGRLGFLFFSNPEPNLISSKKTQVIFLFFFLFHYKIFLFRWREWSSDW